MRQQENLDKPTNKFVNLSTMADASNEALRFEEEVIDGKQYVSDRRAVLAEIEALQAQAPAPASPRMVMPEALAATWAKLDRLDAVPVKRRILSALIERVVMTDEGGQVRLRPQDGLEMPEGIEVARWAPNTRAYLRRAWSKHASACRDCQTTTAKHYSKGLCKTCYCRRQRRKGQE